MFLPCRILFHFACFSTRALAVTKALAPQILSLFLIVIKHGFLSAETLLQEIERVLPSYEQFILDDSLEIEMTHVELLTGGMKTQFVDLERFLKTKQCILTIKNKDNIMTGVTIITTTQESRHAGNNVVMTVMVIQVYLFLCFSSLINNTIKVFF
jgi:hypothetical protein